MTDISNILSGSDNLWKYLFSTGILLISISILYPLRKSEELKLKIIELKNDSSKISKKIEHLKIDEYSFNKYLEIANNEIDSLRTMKSKQIDELLIQEIEKEIATEKKLINQKIRELEMFVIENKGKENYIEELIRQSKSYNCYFIIAIIIGVILTIMGLYKWSIATLASDKLRWKELGLSELEFIKNLFKKS